MDGDFFIGASLASTLTKLALRYGQIASAADRNRFDAEVMLIMAGIIHLGKSGKFIFISSFLEFKLVICRWKIFSLVFLLIENQYLPQYFDFITIGKRVKSIRLNVVRRFPWPKQYYYLSNFPACRNIFHYINCIKQVYQHDNTFSRQLLQEFSSK